MKKHYLYLLLIISVGFTACKKYSIDTPFKGTVVDTYSGRPLPGISLIIQKAESGSLFGSGSVTVLDTILTDVKGKFDYALQCESGFSYTMYPLASADYFPEEMIDEVHGGNKIEFKMTPLVEMKLHLKNDQHMYDSILVEISCYRYNIQNQALRVDYIKAAGKYLDTIITTKVVPNEQNTIEWNLKSTGSPYVTFGGSDAEEFQADNNAYSISF